MIILHDFDNREVCIKKDSIHAYRAMTRGGYTDIDYTEVYFNMNDRVSVLETPSEISALLSSNDGKPKSTKALQLIINLIDNTDIDEISDNEDFIKGYELATERAIDIIRQFKDY